MYDNFKPDKDGSETQFISIIYQQLVSRLVCRILTNYDDYRHCIGGIGGDNFNSLLVRIFFNGLESKHDNVHEDRKFQFRYVKSKWNCSKDK